MKIQMIIINRLLLLVIINLLKFCQGRSTEHKCPRVYLSEAKERMRRAAVLRPYQIPAELKKCGPCGLKHAIHALFK